MQQMKSFFEQLSLFHDLSSHELDRLLEITYERIVPKKSIIFSEGEPKEAVYFIYDGLVKTYKTDENGNEQIVSILKTGDMFPHTGFYHTHPYPATAETIVDTRLYVLPIQLFEQFMFQNPSVAVKMMYVMGEKIVELQERLQSITGQDARQRILTFLLQLANHHGKHDHHTIDIHVPMTHQEIANTIGTTRETINRLLHQLENEGVIKIHRNRILTLYIEQLKKSNES